MTIRLAAPPQKESIVDGPGLRIVIWSQGCKLNCPGCHNPETHDVGSGTIFNIQDIKDYILKYKGPHSGITLSGGDPFLQPEANAAIAQYAHSLGLTVWAYCGLTYEQILQNFSMKKLLENIDVLVDGPYQKELRNITLPFRGSENQRLINVPQSLAQGKIILAEC